MKKLDLVIASIRCIEANLTSARIDLDYVAGVVHYSKFHLHRLFSETVGMSLHDYIQRRRITEAAKLLIFSERPIIDLAITAGYDSQQAFTYAFKELYKTTPNRFRRQGVFYPLQLAFDFEPHRRAACSPQPREISVRLAGEADIPDWMTLVHDSVDGFPFLEDQEHIGSLRRYIARSEAWVLIADGRIIAGILVSCRTGSIDFFAIHPLYRRQGLARELLNVVLLQFAEGCEISTTTYRRGDKADVGYRRVLTELGFAEAELMVELGYPTQKMILTEEQQHGPKRFSR